MRRPAPTDVEFDLPSGRRARRGRATLSVLAAAVPDAEDVHVVNNNAAALFLCALALAAGKEVVLSLGEFVEIGAGFRVPELLGSAGVRLREIGTTNRTRLADYQAALGPDTAFNFRVSGFVSDVDVDELAALDAAVVVDIGSGLLAPHPLLPEEPDATTVLRAGASIVTASGDKLLGGSRAGLILGRADVVEQLPRHPSARALRVDKLTLAALEATLPRARAAGHHRARNRRSGAGRQGPTPRGPAHRGRRRRAHRAVCLDGWWWRRARCRAAEPRDQLAGAARPHCASQPPVVGRVTDGRCLLDLRTVDPTDDERVCIAITNVAGVH